MSEYIGVEQLQERLALSRDTVDRLIRQGYIEAVKIGRSVRVNVDSIEKFLHEHKYKIPGETNA